LGDDKRLSVRRRRQGEPHPGGKIFREAAPPPLHAAGRWRDGKGCGAPDDVRCEWI